MYGLSTLFLLISLSSQWMVMGVEPDYRALLKDALGFFDAQRSGPSQAKDMPWRRPSHLEDGKAMNWNLSGGYYDAGDYVKFGLPGAFAMTTIAQSIIMYENGHRRAGTLDKARRTLKHGLDYLLRCHVSADQLVIQIGDPGIDHRYWGAPEDEPLAQYPRPIFVASPQWPATEPVAEAAAAMAAGFLVFQSVDPVYAVKLLHHAQQLLDLASHYPGIYQGAIQKQILQLPPGPYLGVQNSYESSGYVDDLAWASTWVHLATKNTTFLEKAIQYFDEASLEDILQDNYQGWDDKSLGTAILLSWITKDEERLEDLKEYANSLSQATRTPGGLFWLPDSRDAACNVALSAAYTAYLMYDLGLVNDARLLTFATSQVKYILGENPINQAYVVGSTMEGKSPRNLHHASSQGVPHGAGEMYMLDPKPNRWTIPGAIVGGPRFNDTWEDNRVEFQATEPALDYNAAWVMVLSREAAFR
ncbi:MAG: Six-hairpin glycosidase-like protein [Piptocephalis tieghemiana]|nr:MAG: Six-hairpin glycosidase-like protein [Piptocephalis tieghemiana]